MSASGCDTADSADNVQGADSADNVQGADTADGVQGADTADGVQGADSADNVQGADTADGERKPDVAILPGAVDLAPPVRAGDPVLKLAGDLEHSQTRAENVDGESDLDAPTPRQG